MIERYTKKDPFREREEQKYEHPAPSREYIIQYLEESGQPLSFKHMVAAFGLETETEQEGLSRRLKAMERDGQLMTTRRGSYGLVNKMDLIPGRVEGHRDGFGFLIPDDGSEDIFLSGRQMRCIFPNDRVLVRIAAHEPKRRREGVIVEVIERNTQRVLGRYYDESGIAFIDPDNKAITQDIIIPPGQQGEAKNGQFVNVEITSQPNLRRQPLGRVVEVLGDTFTPGMEVELAIRTHELPFVWPEEVLGEASKLPKTVQSQDLNQRQDLRHLPFVTIDGEDAKDFDDAVYTETHHQGWRIYVAIADVGHYVRPNSALDTHAQLRGNSVYFPTRVIPMLPEELSNELCSLKPNVDRLVTVCEMEVNPEGRMIHSKFYEGVIHSKARLTYNLVAAMLKDAHINREFDSLIPQMHEFHRLYRQLAKQRTLRGAIEFDTVETKILFDDTSRIEKIVPTKRNDAHKMIEEAMLLANHAVALHLEENNILTLYRVHEGPDETGLKSLRDFLKAFGLRLSGGKKPTSMDYAKLLARLEGRPDAHLLQTVMLRSMRQAIYSTQNSGHFGLAYDSYCHFTSPIRRYPDLMVHRALKHLINNKPPEKFFYDQPSMEKLGEHTSVTERRADVATRDAVDWLKCEYMQDKVGQEFEGIISGVTGFGLFIELKDIYVEGLLHITALINDYYHHDPTHHTLIGKNSGKRYRLGDPIRILLARVDLDKREMDFELPGGPHTTEKKRSKPSKKTKEEKTKKPNKEHGKKRSRRAKSKRQK